MRRSFSLSPNFMPILAVFLASGLLLFQGWLHKGLATFAFIVTGWLASICLHEFGHALAAYRGGDDTMVEKGYLTLDPLKYADPFNSIVLPLIFIAMGSIAFPGAAVLIETDRIRSKLWLSFVSLAGPLANAGVLLVIAAFFWIGLDDRIGEPGFWHALAYLGLMQVMVVVMNMLPLPGLDGFNTFAPFLPYEMQVTARRIAPFTVLALMILFISAAPITQGFFRVLFKIAEGVGLDGRDIILGMRAFFFWR